MNQTITGTVHGNAIVFDAPLSFTDGQIVEVVVRNRPAQLPPTEANSAGAGPPAWWTNDDDRILEEIHRARKASIRHEMAE